MSAKKSKKKSIKTKKLIEASTLRRLAVEASCDPRTISRVAEGLEVRGLAGQRAKRVLIGAGFSVPGSGEGK